jgi:hypothetical protein
MYYKTVNVPKMLSQMFAECATKNTKIPLELYKSCPKFPNDFTNVPKTFCTNFKRTADVFKDVRF